MRVYSNDEESPAAIDDNFMDNEVSSVKKIKIIIITTIRIVEKRT
jgi:hypothetical protein